MSVAEVIDLDAARRARRLQEARKRHPAGKATAEEIWAAIRAQRAALRAIKQQDKETL